MPAHLPFLLPLLAHGLAFLALPVAALLALSLASWDGFGPPRFVGAVNYTHLLTRDPLFLRTLVNTFLFAGGTVAVAVPLGFLAALLTWRARGRGLWRAAACLPMVANVVAVGFLGKYLFNGSYGTVNNLLGQLGLAGPPWLTEPGWAMLSVVLMSAWLVVGHNMLLFSAGLADVDERLLEAARLDGAGGWAQTRHVVLPLLRPVLLLAVLSTLVNAVGAFALILVMTEGGPFQSTNVTALYMYQTAFQELRLGRAAAMAVVLFVAVLAIALAQMRLMRRGGLEAW